MYRLADRPQGRPGCAPDRGGALGVSILDFRKPEALKKSDPLKYSHSLRKILGLHSGSREVHSGRTTGCAPDQGGAQSSRRPPCPPGAGSVYYIYIYMYIHMYVCMYIYIYIYIYNHISLCKLLLLLLSFHMYVHSLFAAFCFASSA